MIGASIENLSSGFYCYDVFANNGCSATGDATVASPDSLTYLLEFGNATDGDNGYISVQASGGVEPYAYLWNNSQQTNAIDSLVVGNYFVTIADANGCQVNAQATILNTQIIEVYSQLTRIYPNPTENRITILLDLSLVGSNYLICDVFGKIVHSGKIQSPFTSLELGHLPVGNYLFYVAGSVHERFSVINN